MPLSKRKTYAQPNWSAYNRAQVEEQEHVEELLGGLCEGIVQPPREHKAGRRPILLRDMVFAAIHKVYTTLSGRRAQTSLRQCFRRGLISAVPSYNSVFHALANPELTPLLQRLIEETALPLRTVERHFSPDSTGIGTRRYQRWFNEVGTAQAQRSFIKLHALVGTSTNVIIEARVTDAADSVMLEPLLSAAVTRGFAVEELSADKAYSSKRNISAICAAGAVPYIPFKENTSGRGPAEWRKAYAYFLFHESEFMARYHQRSNAEATFSMLKAKFGASVRSKVPIAQVNECLAKCVCHNLSCLVSAFHEHGIAARFWAGEDGPLQIRLPQPLHTPRRTNGVLAIIARWLSLAARALNRIGDGNVQSPAEGKLVHG